MTRAVRNTFDEAFFKHFYFNRSTAVVTEPEVRKLAAFVLAYLDYLRVDIDNVLDAGCGTGMWRDALRELGRDIDYKGFDPSEFLCGKYGWECRRVADFKSRRKFDLVVCQDVMQYVDDAEASASIDNLARLCRGALYFDVPNREDMKDALDKRLTDHNIHLRTANWYRKRLERHFIAVGGGVFISKKSSTVILELEKL